MSDSHLPKPADIIFDENNIPINLEYNDSFYSRADGFLETETVFIDACDILNRIKISEGFVIAETGFGTGLNFLVTMKKWAEAKEKSGILHFITFEKHILPKEIAAQAHKNWSEISIFSDLLISKWPKSVNGIQRIWFDDLNIALTLVIGEIAETMPKVQFSADAWFLDGFAPSKNPQMWSLAIFENIKRLSAPDVKIGTYSVARIIRDNLTATGFEYAKRQGFAGKRERLEAWLDGKKTEKSFKNIAIIGAGIAGACLYKSLLKRGHSITVFDDDPNNETKASGNYAGLIMPRIDRLKTVESSFFISAFIYAANFYRTLSVNSFEAMRIDEIPKSPRDYEKLQIFTQNPPLPDDILSLSAKSYGHLYGGKVIPPQITSELLTDANIITQKVINVEKHGGDYSIITADGKYDFDIVISAAGVGINQIALEKLPLIGKEGVVSLCDDDIKIANPIAGKGYCINHNRKFVFGATFDEVLLSDIPKMDISHHERNLKTLSEIAPELVDNIDINKLCGRASIRVVSNDKLPIAGQGGDGIYILGALGSRGFSTAPLLAEYIACEISDEPLPIDSDVKALIGVDRYGNN